MVDLVVHRHEMKATIGRIARILMKAPASMTATALVPA
jgi:acetyl-CoA carboxylase beta subunit